MMDVRGGSVFLHTHTHQRATSAHTHCTSCSDCGTVEKAAASPTCISSLRLPPPPPSSSLPHSQYQPAPPSTGSSIKGCSHCSQCSDLATRQHIRPSGGVYLRAQYTPRQTHIHVARTHTVMHAYTQTKTHNALACNSG